MTFKMEDVELSASSMDTLGNGEWIRLKHKPSDITLEFRRRNGAIRRAVKERLVAQLKVLVEQYEPKPTEPTQDSN